MTKKILTYCILVVIPAIGLAQLLETDTSRWQASLNLSGRLNSGNFERFLVVPELNVAHLGKQEKFGFALSQRYTYGTFGEYRSESDLLSRNFLYWKPRSRCYIYLMVWFQTHERQQLSFRYQAGPGITFAILKTKKNVFKLSMTATFEQNRYKSDSLTYIEDPHASRYSVLRGTLRLAGGHIIGGLANLYYEGYFQQAIDNKNNWRVFAECGINVKMIMGFGARLFTTYEYQEVLVIGQKPNDLVFNFGLNYKWASN